MKKLHLRNIIKEVLKEEKGYSRYSPGGTTSGLTKNTLDKILLRIAKGEDLPGDSEERGNKILDKADPENVARILRGEEPVYNEEVYRMQELAGIQSEIKVNSPNKFFDDDGQDLIFINNGVPSIAGSYMPDEDEVTFMIDVDEKGDEDEDINILVKKLNSLDIPYDRYQESDGGYQYDVLNISKNDVQSYIK